MRGGRGRVLAALSLLFACALAVATPQSAMAEVIGNVPDLGIGTGASGERQFEYDTYYLISSDGLSATKENANEDNWNLRCVAGDEGEMDTLYLNDAVISTTLFIPGNIRVVVSGSCSVTSSTAIQVQSEGDVVIDVKEGSSLSLDGGGGDGQGLSASDNAVRVTGAGTLSMTEGGIEAKGDLLIDGDVTVTYTAGNEGSASNKALRTSGDLEISGKACVSLGLNVFAAEGKLTVADNAILMVNNELGTSLTNLVAAQEILVKDSATFSVKGAGRCTCSKVVFSGTPTVCVSVTKSAFKGVLPTFDYDTDCVIKAGKGGEEPQQVGVTVSGVLGAATYLEVTPTTEHAWSRAWSQNDTHHWHACENSYCTLGGNVTQMGGYAEHSFAGYVPNGDATCTQDGTETGTCACGRTHMRADGDSALGHDFGEWELIEPSTCTEKGQEQRACARCKLVETRDADLAAHAWEADHTVDRAATCTQDGSESIHCANCDAVKDSRPIPATGHAWGEPVFAWEGTDAATATFTCKNDATHVEVRSAEVRSEEVAPTCAEAGSVTHTATVTFGGETFEEVGREEVGALGHEPSPERADVADATCIEAGYTGDVACSRCGAVLGEGEPVTPLGHAFGAWSVVGEPSCEGQGVESRSCSRCEQTETRALAATGHSYEDGVCAVCGEKDPAAAKGDGEQAAEKDVLPAAGERGPASAVALVSCGLVALVAGMALRHRASER